MFGAIGFTITLVAATAATVFGFLQARSFTRRKLQFVDAARSPAAPIVAGVGAALLALPVTWFIPFIAGGTAILFGAGVGAGVAAGKQDIVRGRLNP
ncbi:MAG TPA: hypothetical protein VEW03_00605 [Longimicrobiaceae bacterium]|nr:hypothetical protein [Longimicrobiaceae bacterium]